MVAGGVKGESKEERMKRKERRETLWFSNS